MSMVSENMSETNTFSYMRFPQYLNENVDSVWMQLAYDYYPKYEINITPGTIPVENDIRLDRIELYFDPETDLIIKVPETR